MKYISEEQWNKLLCDFADFRKGSGASEKANKGQLFEYIVEYLLENLFGKKIKFKATKASYDGSKDFWAVDEQFKLWWAECKNYSDNISLTQLAPTLFMAELNEVNNLLFFSYSELNQNMKRRIGQYAARHQKDIYIYDDTILEQLIFSYMPPKLKEEYIPTDFETEKPTAEIIYFDEKNPVISDSVGFSGYYDIDELRVGIVYNLNVLVISKNLTKGCDVTASIVQDNDMSYFEFLSHPNTTVCDVKQIKFSVQPCQAVLGSFQVRLIKRKNKIKMPKICLDIKTGGHITQDESHINQKYDCVINNKDAIIGAHYEKIINKVSDNCLNKEKVTGFMVYGGSGTGKTRILEECYANLIRQDYKILNFIGFDINNDWKNVVREIVFYIYGVQDDIALAVLCEALNMVKSPQHIDRDKQTLLKFLPLLNRSETTLAELRPYYSIIFEKMRRSKYAIVIDNLQSYTHDLPQFLNEMLQFYLNCNRSVPVCLMVSINTELIFDEAISTFMSEIIRLKSTSHGHFCCEEIKGFMTEEQAVIFLGKLLCMNDFPRDLSMARNILTKVSLRPKYLEQVANYLIDKEAVRITNGIGIAISYEKLYQTLETAPIDFRTIFHVNYKHMIRIYDGFAEEAKNIVALLYFLGSLTSEYIKAFNVSADVLLILCNHGIIENLGASGFPKYVFEHDLIEICISQDIYQDILEIAVNLVLQHEYALNTYLSAKRGEYLLCRLISDLVTLDELRTIDNNLFMRIPNKFLFGFAFHLIRSITRFAKEMDQVEFIKRTLACCKYVRDHISERLAIDLFEMSKMYIDDFQLNSQDAVCIYHSFIVHMAENKIRVGEYNLALLMYHQYLNQLPSFSSIGLSDNWLAYAAAYINNRIFVCGKFEGNKAKYMDFLETSKRICEIGRFHDVMFENYFDEANLYLGNNTMLDTVVHLLNTGFKHYNQLPPERKEKFAVNYHSKKILLLCILKKFDEVLDATDTALQMLQYNERVNYHLFFKSKYLKYRIIALLILKRTDMEVTSLLEDYEIVMSLLGKVYEAEIAIYRAKLAYLQSEEVKFAFYFRLACDTAVNQDNQQADGSYALALEELALKYRALCENGSTFDLHEGLNMNRAKAVFAMSSIDFENFFARYISKAPLSDIAKRDGYFFV